MSEPARGRHTRRWLRRTGREFDKFRRDAFRESDMNDEMAEITEIRVTLLEEAVAARWPRSILVRRRLARDIRASVRHVQGVTFLDKRTEAIGSGWIGLIGGRQQ